MIVIIFIVIIVIDTHVCIDICVQVNYYSSLQCYWKIIKYSFDSMISMNCVIDFSAENDLKNRLFLVSRFGIEFSDRRLLMMRHQSRQIFTLSR